MTVDEIVLELNDELMRFAMHLGKNYSTAEDLYQDALVKALENEDLFCDMHVNQVKAWLFKTMRNRHVDRIRKEASMNQVNNHIENVCDYQETCILSMMMDKLSEVEQLCLNYKFYHGYKSHEIGERMNLNPSTIRNHVSRGLSKLRTAYEEEV